MKMSSETLKPFINSNESDTKRKFNLPFLMLSIFVLIFCVAISIVVVSSQILVFNEGYLNY